jgi:hypothetical protein
MKGKLTLETRQLCEQLKNSWSEMHWVDRSVNLLHLKKGTNLSERNLAFCFQLSKSEIHRMIAVAGLSQQMRDVCKEFDTDYHVLCLFAEAPSSARKEELRERIVNGSIRRHKAAREFLGGALRLGRKKADVIINETGLIRCRVCGKSQDLFLQIHPDGKLAVDVLEYANAIKTWSQPHKRCKRIL